MKKGALWKKGENGLVIILFIFILLVRKRERERERGRERGRERVSFVGPLIYVFTRYFFYVS